MLIYIIFGLLFSLGTQLAQGAACCGGGTAFPTLITGDHRAQITTQFSHSNIVGDARNDKYFSRQENDKDASTQLTIDGAYLLSEYLQFSASLPLVQRNKDLGGTHESHTSLGDLSLGASYEFLPELSYSAWKPRGFVFLRTFIPTAHSIYDATSTLKSDAIGDGFWGLSLGTAFVKTYKSWDFLLGTSMRGRFNRSFDSVSVEPGWIWSSQLGVGFSPITALRVGLSIEPLHTGPSTITQNASKSESKDRLVWNSAFTLSYLMADSWMAAVSYADQTLLGPAKNTTLERTISLQIQKRVPL